MAPTDDQSEVIDSSQSDESSDQRDPYEDPGQPGHQSDEQPDEGSDSSDSQTRARAAPENIGRGGFLDMRTNPVLEQSGFGVHQDTAGQPATLVGVGSSRV